MIDAKVFNDLGTLEIGLKVYLRHQNQSIFKFTGKTPIKMMMELKNL